MSDPVSLGVMIRTRRHAARLTQEELAEKAGISLRTISDIERGLRRFVYRDTAERLAQALEVPDGEKERFVAVARGRVRGDEPTPRPGGALEPLRAGHIPVPPTLLVGRDGDIGRILALLEQPRRLITLTGPGGIGKSRLAAEAARQARVGFGGRVCFVQLASADAAARVVPLIAEALEMPEPDDQTVADISAYFADTAALLVLDTFEHVLGAATSVSGLLSFCDSLTVLVTSREPLRIQGEHVLPVAPLPVPPEGSSDLLASAAGLLLLDRMRAATGDVHLDDESSALLADVCRRLEGLPLAIELAARRIHHLPLVTLRDQLNARLSLLTRGGPDLPRRQRTIRATIGWSYDLLEARERSLFRALSVFAAGWTLDAARRISMIGDEDVLDTLSALVDKSLVAMTGGETRLPRYSMMDVIAEFSAEQRDQYGETRGLMRSHAEYFVSLAERAESNFGTPEQEESYAELLAEHDNLRAALRWSIGGEDPGTGLRLASALWRFWRAAGYLSEGRSWLEQALRASGDASGSIRAKALWGACWLAFQQDDLPSARRYSEELLEVTRDDEESLGRRNALTVQAMLHMAEGRYSEAIPPLERSVAIAKASGSRWHLATSELNFALGLLHLRRLDQAARVLEDVLHLYEQVGDERFAARALSYRGHVALLDQDLGEATSMFYTACRRAMQVNDEDALAGALEGLAATSAASGDIEQAAILIGASTHKREGAMSKTLPFERRLVEAWLDEAQDTLGDKQWTTLLERGAEMGNVDVLALVERSMD